MDDMLRLTSTVAAVVLASIMAETAPRPGDAPSIPIRIVVTDSKGRHVTGLSAADIEVREAGQPRPVRAFSAADRRPRTLGILLDDYHVSATAAEAAVPALLDFVERYVRSDDIVFVMRPPDPASSLAPVKHEVLRAAVSAFVGRKENYAPANPFEAEYLSAAPPTAARQRAQVSRAAMQALATALSKVSDVSTTPRALVVVTEGFPTDDRGRERLPTLRTAARAARLANAAVYVLDPSPATRTQTPFGEQWQTLTSQTGGMLSTAGSPLMPALARIAQDLDASYLLTIPEPDKEDGAYHRLEIVVKRKDAVVRGPSGYWAPLAAERLTVPSRPAMATYLKTPHITGLIQPWFRMTKAENGRTRVTFSWAPRSGRPRGNSLAFSAVTFEGKRLADGQVAPQGDKDHSTRIAFDAAPGPIQVSMAITDAAGKILDTEVRYIDVPALETPGAMIAAVEVVRTRTLREFLERQLIADAMPADTSEFDRRDRLIVRVRAFSQGDDAPLVVARLLNPLGQPIRELTPLSPVDGVPQFDLPLASYARGEYRIEIRATSGEVTVAQLVMFRLIG